MKTGLKIVLVINLVVLAVLSFVYPHLMIAPGDVGHRKINTNCFACHAPFTGASSERCTRCHKPADIGRLTTKGNPVTKPSTVVPFHQDLIRQDCIACHSEHTGVRRLRQTKRFDHTLLRAEVSKACLNCHKVPDGQLHRQIDGNCSQCHSQERWTPAAFDHDKYFVLDRDHNVKCATCHVGNDYSRYTCFGCHEHTPEKIQRKHIKEGIHDFQNCVECHRSADEHASGGKEKDRKGKSNKHNRQHKKDDD